MYTREYLEPNQHDLLPGTDLLLFTTHLNPIKLAL